MSRPESSSSPTENATTGMSAASTPLGRELLVEADVGVAVDCGDHADLLAAGAQRHDVGDDLGPVGVAEGRVVDEDVFLRDAGVLEVLLEDVVGGPRIDVVGAEQREELHADLLEEVVDRRDRLLVRRGAGVEDVLRALLALVLDGVEEQAVQLLDHRQDGLAADGGPVAEDHVDVVDGEQLARLLGEERPVRRWIDDHRLELAAQKAALLVLLVDKHQDGVLQRRLGNRHRAAQRVQHADLDRALGFLCAGDCGGGHQCGRGRQHRFHLDPPWPLPDLQFHLTGDALPHRRGKTTEAGIRAQAPRCATSHAAVEFGRWSLFFQRRAQSAGDPQGAGPPRSNGLPGIMGSGWSKRWSPAPPAHGAPPPPGPAESAGRSRSPRRLKRPCRRASPPSPGNPRAGRCG